MGLVFAGVVLPLVVIDAVVMNRSTVRPLILVNVLFASSILAGTDVVMDLRSIPATLRVLAGVAVVAGVGWWLYRSRHMRLYSATASGADIPEDLLTLAKKYEDPARQVWAGRLAGLGVWLEIVGVALVILSIVAGLALI